MAKPSELPIWNTNNLNVTNPTDPDYVSRKSNGWAVVSGVPEKPPVGDFNYWQRNSYLWLNELNTWGSLDWDATTEYEIGSIARGSDSKRYRSLIASNIGNDPISSPTSWIPSEAVTVNITQITSTGAGFYVKPNNLIAAIVETQAGGGGSDNVPPTTALDTAGTTGGSGGGYSKRAYTASELLFSPGEPIAIGVGGPVATVGGNTTFSSGTKLLDTRGGNPGVAVGPFVAAYIFSGVGGGIVIPSPGGSVDIIGGSSTYISGVNAIIASISHGGDSPFGRGGIGVTGINALPGSGFGSGGGGVSTVNVIGGVSGAAGNQGVIVVTEMLAI